MAVAVRVLTGAYHDSVKLMRISASASEKPGVRRAVAVMGTPMNREQLASSGLLAAKRNAQARTTSSWPWRRTAQGRRETNWPPWKRRSLPPERASERARS